MNPYKLEKGAMRGVFFFGFLIALIVNTNFLQWGLLIIAPLSILATYFILGPLFKRLDFRLKKENKEK
jgi:hypothetical protein